MLASPRKRLKLLYLIQRRKAYASRASNSAGFQEKLRRRKWRRRKGTMHSVAVHAITRRFLKKIGFEGAFGALLDCGAIEQMATAQRYNARCQRACYNPQVSQEDIRRRCLARSL